MFSLLFIGVTAKETIDNPPIAFSSPVISGTDKDLKADSLEDLRTKLTNTGQLDSEQITRIVNKMKFAKTSRTIEHNFDMGINPYEPSSRKAKKTSVVLKIEKVGSTFTIEMHALLITLPVYSQVVKTTSSTFLWWEWNKKIEVEWRPLTAAELQKVHNQVDYYLSPYLQKYR